MSIKGIFILQLPHVKAIFGRKNCPVKIVPQNGGFSEIYGSKYQGTSLPERRLLSYFT